MAQLRQDYAEFTARDAEIVVVAPEKLDAVRDYWKKEKLPFVGLSDPDHKVAKVYGQQVKWLKFGRMPALAVIDKQGYVHYRHYGDSMSDIPTNGKVLALLDELNGGKAP
jgi:peroxiredoxin